jgi:hypothetical protein
MNTISDERKETLKSVLFEKGATKKMLADIEDIQELIFLIVTLNECTDKNVGFNIDDSRELIYKQVTSRLSQLPEYFLLADNNTGGIFIHNNYADIFSCEEFANDALKQYADMGIDCSLLKIDSKNTNLPKNIDVFTYLYYLGIKYIMVDSTAYGMAVKRSEILSKSQIKKENVFKCEVENPSLRFAVCNFYGSLKNKQALNVSESKLKNLENIMIYETAHAKYLVPVKYKGEKVSADEFNKNSQLFTMAKTVLETQGEMITVFTDKMEFDKSYPEGWDYIVLDFDTLSTIGRCNGIVVNVSSERLSIDKRTIEHIKKTAKKMVLK